MKGPACRPPAGRAGQAGFTLAELVIALAIASVVGVLLMAIFTNNTGLFYKESSKVSQGVLSNDALSSIRGYIKQAQSVASSYSSGSTTYTTGTNQLILNLPTINSSGEVLEDTFDLAVYTLDKNNLIFKLFPNEASQKKPADQVLAKNVENILFEYFDGMGQAVSPTSAVKIQITLTLTQKLGLTNQSNIATTEANLRNN